MYNLLRLNRLRDLWNLSQRAYGGYKKHIIFLMALGLAGGVLEGIGINALIPLFSFALGESIEGADKITLLIQKFFEAFNLSFSLKYLLVFIALLFIVRAFVLVWFEYLRAYIASDYEKKTREKLFSSTLNASWPYLIKQKAGYLESLVMVDVPFGGNILRHVSSFIMRAFGLLIYVIVAINISLSITLITLGLGVFIFLLLKPFLSRVKQVARKRARVNKQISHHISENIFGAKTIKATMAAKGVEEKARVFFQKLRGLTIKASLLKGTNTILIEPVGIIFIVILFGYTYKSGAFGFAQFIPIVYLIQKIFIYIQQLQTGMHGVNDGLPHLQSILDYQSETGENREIGGGRRSFVFKKKIEFRDVHFSYSGGGKDSVLKGVNFVVERGEMVGLIGPSGAGKTTIVDLILRLLRPTSGRILLDDLAIDGIGLRQWRKKIGYVSQDIFLVNDTIRNNIVFYQPDLSDDEIMKAAQMAHIDEVIEKAPQGLDTVIGDRGVRLSAGQRQRVVIARVLAREPEFLILDEATSALDNESELQIHKVIESLKGQVTVLAIAHRLSTVENSDKLIVLGEGRISEQGSPRQLLKDKESYFSKTYNLRK